MWIALTAVLCASSDSVLYYYCTIRARAGKFIARVSRAFWLVEIPLHVESNTALPDELVITSPFVQQNYLLTDWLISLTSLSFQPRFWRFLRLLAAGNLLKMGGLAPRGSPTHFRRLPAACSLKKRQNLGRKHQKVSSMQPIGKEITIVDETKIHKSVFRVTYVLSMSIILYVII